LSDLRTDPLAVGSGLSFVNLKRESENTFPNINNERFNESIAPVEKLEKHHHSYILVRLNPMSFKILLYSSRVVNDGVFSSPVFPVVPVSPTSPEF
jgi:hypothetical protein